MLNYVKPVVFAALMFCAVSLSTAGTQAPLVKASSFANTSVQTAERVVRLLGSLMSRSNLKFNGEVRLTKKPGFHAEAFFGSPGYIELGEDYANQLSDGELTFVIGHELAHLCSDHQSRLLDAYAKKTSAGLSANQAESVPLSVLHQNLELDADRVGLEWTLRAGFSATDAVGALERAYNGSQQPFATHPALSSRKSALLGR